MDICELILQSHDLDQTLNNIVNLVAVRMRTEVCSIYLLEGSELQLKATVGLAPRSVGRVTLQLGEGLVGHTAQREEVVNAPEPQSHPRFRYFAESNEEQFHSFLGIPLHDGRNLIGVMAIQTVEHRDFCSTEVSTLTTIALQLSTVISNARLLETLDRRPDIERFERSTPQDLASVLRGDPFQSGVAVAPAYVVNDTCGMSEVSDHESTTEPRAEAQRLDIALEKTRVETLCLEKRVASQLTESDAAIFHSHLMILQDNSFIEKLNQLIEQGQSAPYAVKSIVRQYVSAFHALEDPYLRERSCDMEDIGKRILNHLCGTPTAPIKLQHPCIIVADDLLPSEIASLDFPLVRGIVLEAPQSNGHAAIVAKSMGIPTLVAVKDATRHIEPGAPLILDANSGCLYVEPEPGIKREYQRLLSEDVAEKERLLAYADREPKTLDGEKICLRANIGLLSDVAVAHRNGAKGVGLYRTEFPFMMRATLPTRDEQYELYRKVIEGFRGEQVTIRTLDIGGDKNLRSFPFPKEENPALGLRSVRISISHPDVFRTQVDAILMASTHGPVRMLLPMVTNLHELRTCKTMIAECRARLVTEGWSIRDVPLGVMIEVPAAVAIADHLAREADFFALGTNDLIQYLLAADRGNPSVRTYYDPLHPAVLQAVSSLVDVCERQDRELCLCGEMASDSACLAILVGLGLREFSVAAPTIPKLKELLAAHPLSVLEDLAHRVMKLGDGEHIREQAEQLLATEFRNP